MGTEFWFGFSIGVISLMVVCLIWVWVFPGKVRRGVKKFEDQRDIQAEKDRMKKIWKQFYVSQNPINFKK